MIVTIIGPHIQAPSFAARNARLQTASCRKAPAVGPPHPDIPGRNRLYQTTESYRRTCVNDHLQRGLKDRLQEYYMDLRSGPAAPMKIVRCRCNKIWLGKRQICFRTCSLPCTNPPSLVSPATPRLPSSCSKIRLLPPRPTDHQPSTCP